MFRKKLILFAVAALIALLATGWVSQRMTQKMADAVRWVDHTRQVLLAVDLLRAGVAEAESNARGYVITGVPPMEQRFALAASTLPARLIRVQNLTADNKHQVEAITTLDRLVERRVGLLRMLIAQKHSGAADAEIAAGVVAGSQTNREIANALADIQSEELRLLERRQRDAERAHAFAVWAPWLMSGIATIVFLALLAQVWFALKSELEIRRNLERAVEQETLAREQAQRADRLKDEFLITVSHELRTPLTAIVGWSGLLSSASARETMLEEGLNNIAQAARVQSLLIEDLLDVSRILTGQMKLSVVEIDLVDVIEQAIASVNPSADARQIRIKRVLERGIEGVHGDPTRLQQVVWNVLTNAVKFTHKGGTVDVILRRVNSHVEISVTDDGEGIDAAFLPHVFDRFRQADTSPTRHAGGLGLGLAIVKELVQLHGGAVRAESAGHGTGSRFTIELPLGGMRVDAASAPIAWRSARLDLGPQPPSDARPAIPPELLRGRRIVVVEDDIRTLRMLEITLMTTGASVIPATTTADALTLLAADRTDAVLCDIGLPDEDGLTFIRRLRAMSAPYAHVPAIALTAFARTEDRVSALSAGFNAYLAKPVTRDELLFSIASLLDLGRDSRVEEPASHAQP